MHLLVMAKTPVAGRVKTRLSPQFTPGDAACLAHAALADTLDAAMAAGADRVVVALDGEPGEWLPHGARVVPQRGHRFVDRLANAWADTGAPGVQIGMDTPQVTASDLNDAMTALAGPEIDAVLGPATDGGWWAIGFVASSPGAFAGVPMSAANTGVHQLRRLHRLGLRVATLAEQRDVDTAADADAVAALAPSTRFAARLAAIHAAVAV
jgi:glycosyltransferase A (GT-A) superfamily protein (DUF2064 family)